ncbi:MAG: hypothetical protein J7L94_16170, partial [Caldisericaceae bacterium]|nr:hypothetical protein [Caldisericaceae bacterium]
LKKFEFVKINWKKNNVFKKLKYYGETMVTITERNQEPKNINSNFKRLIVDFHHHFNQKSFKL